METYGPKLIHLTREQEDDMAQFEYDVDETIELGQVDPDDLYAGCVHCADCGLRWVRSCMRQEQRTGQFPIRSAGLKRAFHRLETRTVFVCPTCDRKTT